MQTPPLLIATGNEHKIEEITAVLETLDIPCEGLASVGNDITEPVEDGDSFEANARIKAIGYAKATNRVCLADDSGLEIDALDGRPGVYSARYAREEVPGDASRAERDAANNAKVIRELADTPDEHRGARFVCAICVAAPTGEVLAEVRGTFEGRIGNPATDTIPRGTNGFGYDPLFLVAPDHARTSAELPSAEKNAKSHRGQALAMLAEAVRSGTARLRSN